MKTYLKIIFAFVFLMSVSTMGALTDADRQEFAVKNLLADHNPGMESGKASWAKSGGTLTSITSGSNLLIGKGSITWDSSSADQTLSSDTITIPKGLYGRPGVFQMLIMVPSGNATHKMQIYDGTNVLAEQSIASSTTPILNSLSFLFPSSGTVQARLISVNANEPSITLDEAYLGSNFMLAPVSQAQFYGGSQMFGASSCAWTRNSAGSEGTFSAESNCNAPTLSGNATTTAGKTPGISFAKLPPGHYAVALTIATETTTSADCRWYITDGTTHGNYLSAQGSLIAPITFHQDFDYTAAQGATQFQLGVRHVSGGGGCNAFANSSLADMQIMVYRYPTTAETVFTPETTNWHIDANIGNYTNTNYFSMGSSDISTFTAPNLADLSLILNPGSANAKITCSSTNPPTGLTCGAGNEEAGINFDLPAAQDVEICGQFDHYTDTTSGSIRVAFSWIETLSNSQSLIQDCGPSTISGIDSGTQGAHHPTNVCGVCHFTSAGNKTVRLMRKQNHSGTVSVNAFYVIDPSADVGQQYIKVTARPMNQTVPPVVISNAFVGAIYYADPNTTSTTSIASGSNVIIDYNVKVEDPDNAVTTGASWHYTVPSGKGGIFQVDAGIELNTAPAVDSLLLVEVNSAVTSYGKSYGATSGASNKMTSRLFRAAAGDQIDVRIFQRNTSNSINDYGGAANLGANYVSIHRVSQ